MCNKGDCAVNVIVHIEDMIVIEKVHIHPNAQTYWYEWRGLCDRILKGNYLITVDFVQNTSILI